MAFDFEHRPYGGQNYRPRPEVHIDRDANLILIATPWGPRDSAKKVIDRMLDYFLLAKQDTEVTSPFERLSCLSTAANNLRIAALLANEMLYREENKQEFKAGVELFSASFEDNEFVWLQVGQPQILLARKHMSLKPLGSYVDLSADLGSKTKPLPPLPNQLLGLDSSVNFSINSFRVQPNDKIILASHSDLPENIYSLKSDAIEIDKLSGLLASSQEQTAFWLGLLSIQNDSRGAT